ncbi:MAG: excalibur calcium-binding protein [Chloroflexi bacterium]|nr:excalibur calcium-binding protein [Chloroflexota bacterium]
MTNVTRLLAFLMLALLIVIVPLAANAQDDELVTDDPIEEMVMDDPFEEMASDDPIEELIIGEPSVPPSFDPAKFLGMGDRWDCGIFDNQAQAQAVLRADSSDPNRLDLDRDGVACELSLGAQDHERVPR